jgi:cytidine deaminase
MTRATKKAVATIDWSALEAGAFAARRAAYAPYSTYRVGAALLVASGRVFTGCNVENASYGLCLCAERNAIGQMVAAGERDPIALVVATDGPKAGSPCGMCRQVLAEFATKLPIRLVVDGAPRKTRKTDIATLLPDAFRPEDLLGPKAPR